MIWTPTPGPTFGTVRVVRRFAIVPVTLINGDRLWLQRYYATEQWTARERGWLDDGQDEAHDRWVCIARTSVHPSPALARAALTRDGGGGR
jgi:hypothetical protein